MVIYVPGTEETDPKKQNMSLQQLGAAVTANQTNTATNTTNIATNTASIAAMQSAWTTYSPTITAQTGTITTLGAVSGRYKQIGKTIILQVDATVTTAGTAGAGLVATLPFTAAAFAYIGSSRDSGVTGKGGPAFINASGTTVVAQDSATLTYFANGARVVIGITYEIP